MGARENPAPVNPLPSSPAEDQSLVAALKTGEEQAYEQLVRRFGGWLLGVARRLVHGEQEAQDALQDAFLSAFKAIDRFQGDASLATWLHRITVNAALMRLRHRRRRPETLFEDLSSGDGARQDPNYPPVNWSESAEVAAERAETREFVRAMIDELPDTYRTVLVLRDIEEYDTAETAKELGITPNAVKIRLHRARQALRDRIDRRLRAFDPEARP